MLQCKSMYFAGNIVDASSIDSYEDYKRLGLVCPFCNEAVFFRKPVDFYYSEGINKQRQACFSHYRGGHQCELRSCTSKGIAEIEKIKAEKKNQRLKLYNNYLWEIISTGEVLPKQVVYKQLKLINKKNLDRFVNTILNNWNTLLEGLIQNLSAISDMYVDKMFFDNVPTSLIGYAKNKQSYYMDSKFDKHMHISICIEVLYYLNTVPGKYVLKKLLVHTIVGLFIISREESIRNINMDIRHLLDAVCNVLYGVRWVDEVNKRL